MTQPESVSQTTYAVTTRPSNTRRLPRTVLGAIDGPDVLVGHSYGGMVISNVPAAGESAAELSGRYPGSSLGETLVTVER